MTTAFLRSGNRAENSPFCLPDGGKSEKIGGEREKIAFRRRIRLTISAVCGMIIPGLITKHKIHFLYISRTAGEGERT